VGDVGPVASRGCAVGPAASRGCAVGPATSRGCRMLNCVHMGFHNRA
jgi:hypothetical protein